MGSVQMSYEELSRRVRNGTPLSVLAQLNDCSEQTIKNFMKKFDGEPEEKVTAPFEISEALKERFTEVLDMIEADVLNTMGDIDFKREQLKLAEAELEKLKAQSDELIELLNKLEVKHD